MFLMFAWHPFERFIENQMDDFKPACAEGATDITRGSRGAPIVG
jgi:hypothetical protein